MRAPRVLAFVLVASVVVIGCGGTAPGGTGEPLADPVEATASRDGVAVSLLVDRVRVAPGADVTATVSVRNVAPGVVTWQGGGCELEGDVAITPVRALGAAPIGRVWDGDKNALKQLALPEAYAIRTAMPPQFAHVDANFGCPANLAYHELEPGEEARATIVWVASTVAGSPAPAGDYVVSVRFPYVGRDIGDPFANAGGVLPDPDAITAQLVVTVEDHPGVPSPSEALDAILADPAFTDWLADHPSRAWNSAAIRFVDGAWVVQVRYEPNWMLSARRDPSSGEVSLSEGEAASPRP